jgi:hypothetical protein
VWHLMGARCSRRAAARGARSAFFCSVITTSSRRGERRAALHPSPLRLPARVGTICVILKSQKKRRCRGGAAHGSGARAGGGGGGGGSACAPPPPAAPPGRSSSCQSALRR